MKTKHDLKPTDFMRSPVLAILALAFYEMRHFHPYLAYKGVRSVNLRTRLSVLVATISIITIDICMWSAHFSYIKILILTVCLLFACCVGVLLFTEGYQDCVAKWSDFCEMVEVLSEPVFDHYKGSVVRFDKPALQKAVRDWLVGCSKKVLRFEEDKTGPMGLSEEVLKKMQLTREQFSKVHTVALKYGLVEQKWDLYFNEARNELEKDPK